MPFMRTILTCIIGLLVLQITSAQTVSCSRSAQLENGGYSLTGTAVLERLDNNISRLRLENNFVTPSGPDVVIFLSNDSTSVSGALRVADIGTIDGLSHFSGAISFDLPTGTNIDEYRYIVFRCLQFNLHWGTGVLGTSNCENNMPMEEFVCDSTTISFAEIDSNSISLCVTDGVSDVIRFANSRDFSLDNFVYIVTDINNRIQHILNVSSFNFEGSITGTSYVYGLSFGGNLAAEVGNTLNSISADSCYTLTDESTRLTIVKTSCVGQYECSSTATATTNWVTEVRICPDDNQPDEIPLVNSAFLEPGINFAYLVTDTNDLFLFLIRSTSFNFEGSTSNPNRIYGISYDGDLNTTIGRNIREVTSTGCWQLSDTTLFLTVFKDACIPYECSPTITAADGWLSEVIVCPSDGIQDRIILRNTGTDSRDHYAYIVTNEAQVIQHVVIDSVFDFEGSINATQFVFGVSFDGELTAPIGSGLSAINASGCHIISDTTQFLRVFKTGCVDSTVTGSIRGRVLDVENRPLANIDIFINGSKRVMTNSSGRFEISDLTLGDDFTMTAEHPNSDHLNGVRTSDLVLIGSHLLGSKPFTTTFQSLAADANFDGRVTVTDMVKIRNTLLGNDANFEGNKAWKFVNGMSDYSTIRDLREIPESIIVKNLSTSTTELIFRAIKVGDVDGSAN